MSDKIQLVHNFFLDGEFKSKILILCLVRFILLVWFLF
jgi:hypothetical protein